MHTIRLRGPWQFEPLARFVFSEDQRPHNVELPWDEDPRAGRVVMPCDWSASLGAEFRGRVRYRRRFGCPTGMEPGESAHLVFDRVTSFGTVTLNELLLGVVTEASLPSEFEITSQLRPSNLLTVVVEHPAGCDCDSAAMLSPGGLTGEVRLVIR